MTTSVLVVEDEPNIILSLEFLVKVAGYKVRVLCDGGEALRAVADDYITEPFSTRELTQRLKQILG